MVRAEVGELAPVICDSIADGEVGVLVGLGGARPPAQKAERAAQMWSLLHEEE